MFDFITDWEGCIDRPSDVATLACIPIVLQNLINALVVIAGIASVFMIVWAGYKYVMSEGDPEKVSSARKTLAYAIVGLIIVFLSFVILQAISEFTGVSQIAPK